MAQICISIYIFAIPILGNLAAIYATGCLPEHNCVPSCHRSFDEDLSITLRAAVPLGHQRISSCLPPGPYPLIVSNLASF